MANPQQARENREYVRTLLKDKQPEFAAALEFVEREIMLTGRLDLGRSGGGGLARILRASLGRELGNQARALAGAALHDQCSTGSLNAVLQANHAGAASRICPTGPVVTDREPHHPARRLDGDADSRGAGVLGRVGQRL